MHLFTALTLLLLVADTTNGFIVTSPSSVLRKDPMKSGLQRLTRQILFSSENTDDDEDVTPFFAGGNAKNDTDVVETSAVVDEREDDAEPDKATSPLDKFVDIVTAPARLQENLSFLQTLGAISSRGEFATKAQKEAAEQALTELEEQNPTPEPANSELILGQWTLVYSSTQLFRSSPFFMAGRAVCKTEDQRKQYDWFCDMHRKALAISQIGVVRQIVSTNKLVSEFEVHVGAIPFLNDFTPFSYSGGWPVAIEGALVSTADLTTNPTGTGFELYMDTVEVKGSNIPVLRQILDSDNVKLESRKLADALESAISSYTTPRPIFETTYLDDKFRLSRDQDGNAFFYVKTSTDTSLTDYSSKDSDLGIGRLLEGFNDAIAKVYL